MLKRTFSRAPPAGTENVSKAYNTLDDLSPVEIHPPRTGDNSFGGASGGMFTCVKDLLTLYKALMAAAND